MVDTGIAIKKVKINGQEMLLQGTGNAINKLPQVMNKTVTELTADDLRGLTSIPASWQNGNKLLGRLEIPNTVSTIGTNAFNECNNLTKVVFEEGSLLTNIPNNCFSRIGVADVYLPDSIETIGGYAFNGINYSGHSITVRVGSGIKTIEGVAFTNRGKITLIFNKKCLTAEDVPTLSSKLGAICTVYVPDETTQTLLQNATNWSASTIKLISELPEEVA